MILRVLLVLLTCLVAPVLEAAEAEPEVEFVLARPEAGFNFPYFLRMPPSASADGGKVLIVEVNNSGSHEVLDEHVRSVEATIRSNALGPMVAGALGQPLLMPAFPRSKAQWQYYTHALDRDSIRLADDPRARLDVQLLAMVDDAQKRLKARSIEVAERFVLVGFSASGTFANRFAFLHPERLQAVVSGGINAIPMLPVAEFRGERLQFPLGVADIEAISGRPFQADHWRKLPQLVFMGADDDNDAVPYDDAYSEDERRVVHRVLGEAMDVRWLTAQKVCLRADPDMTFVTYGAVGHWTDGRINADIVNFVQQRALQRGTDGR